jgi:hypothetical protein
VPRSLINDQFAALIIQLAGKSIFFANCVKTTSHGGASEQCVMRTARVVKPLPAKEITMKKPRKSAPEAHLNGNGQESLGTANPIPSDEPALLAKQETVVNARKVAAKTGKGARRPPRAASGSDPEKLVCRYWVVSGRFSKIARSERSWYAGDEKRHRILWRGCTP